MFIVCCALLALAAAYRYDYMTILAYRRNCTYNPYKHTTDGATSDRAP